MRYLLFLTVCLFPCHLNAQSFIDFKYEDNLTTCICNDISAKNIIDTLHTIKNERFIACCYHCIGTYYYHEARDWSAIEYHQKALKIREQYKDDLRWKSYRNIAYAYKEVAHYEGTIKAILQGFQLNDKLKRTANYRLLGESYIELGEFENAIEALENSERLAQNDYELAEANNALCIALTKTEDTTNLVKALKHAEKAIELFERENDMEGIAIAYLNKGNTHEELKQHEAAIRSYNQAKAIFLQKKRPLSLAKTINNIATVKYAQGQYNEAIQLLNESLKLKKEYHKNEIYQYTYAANYENLAENYEALSNTDEALKHYQLALINLTDNFRNQDINTNPTVAGNHYIYKKANLLRILDLKAQTTMKNGNTDLAYKTYQVLDEWINEFYKDLTTNESKLTWIARTHDIYTNAIEVALKKEDKAKAFEYAEKARAVLLWQSHLQQAALSLLNDEEQESYDDLLAQIRRTDYEYRNAVGGKEQLKNTIDSLNQKFDQFEKTLEEKYPEYAQRKYQPKTITPSDVQNRILNQNSALVEYHWASNDKLYIFILTKKNIYTDVVQVNDDFHEQIQKFHTAIKDSNLPDIVKPGYAIYQTAFQPIHTHLKENVKKLIILPDGKLNFIPFEALPTNSTNNVFDISYLIDDYTFNYLYSCSNYSNSSYTNSIQTALIIAPEFGVKDTFATLENTQIAKQLKGFKLTTLTGAKPTHSEVVNEIPNADLIHIAAHAKQGAKGKGKIHLYGGDELSQNDIQACSFKAQHVVLSACETGAGELNKGEGVLSLGWSFVYRGVPSVVMSLWKVNDDSTEKLMNNYYQLLHQKIPADEALQQAKRSLRQEQNALSHPYHWAAFIHTGNPPTKHVSQNNHKLFYMLGGLMLLFLFISTTRRLTKR